MISPGNRLATMSYSLPVHLLRQYCFCPRIPWYQEVLGLRPIRPLWVQQGENFDTRQPRLFRQRTLLRFGLQTAHREFGVSVASEQLHMHGRVDCVLKTETELFPVEIKLAGRKPDRGHILQLAAYGMLLAATYRKPVRRGFILMGKRGKSWAIEINQQLRREVCRVRDSILLVLEEARMPDSSASIAQCGQCEYLNWCNDRE